MSASKNNKNQESNIQNDIRTNSKKFSNIKNYLCPFNVNCQNLNHIKLLTKKTKFARSFFVNTLPRLLNFSEFIRPLFNITDTNTSVYIYPIKEGIAQSNLNEIISNINIQINEAIKTNDESKVNVLQQKKMEVEVLRDEISTKFNKLFEVTILSTLYADSEEELDYLSNYFATEMSRNTINIKSIWSEQVEALKSNLPCCNNTILRNNTFDTFGTATVFPFISTDTSHPNGIPVGVNKKSNMLILIDIFDSSFLNNNFIIFGKITPSTHLTVQLLSLRSFALAGTNNIIIDSNGLYSKLTGSVDGKNINLNPESKIIINPFDIDPEIIKDDITGREHSALNLENKIEDVTNILMTMARGSVRSQYVNNITKKIIKEVVTEEYNDKGITNEPDSLYGAHGANLVGTKIIRTKKTLPTIGSWYNRLCKKAESNTSSEYKYQFEYLVKYMKDYVKELDGKYSSFDGQTNFDLNSEISLIDFNLSKLDEKFLKPLTYQIILSFIWEKYIKSNSEDKAKSKKKSLVIDQAHLLLSYTEAVDFLNTLSQRSTKRNVGLIIVSEKFDDFYQNNKLHDFLSKASVKLFMKQDQNALEKFKETFKLTNGEKEFLGSCYKNEGILQVGSNSAQIIIDATPYELELIESELDTTSLVDHGI